MKGGLEVRVGLAQKGHDLIDFARGYAGRLARQCAPLHLQMTAIGIAAELAPALDQRGVQRGRSQQRVRWLRLQVTIEGVEPRQNSCHQTNRVAPIARTAAMRGAAFGFNLHPLEALVRHRDGQVGGLGDDGGVGSPPGDQRFSADARVLFVGDAGNHELAGGEAARFRNDPGGADHRRDAALHVLRTASINAAVALGGIERPRHARDANRVDMAAEHERPSWSLAVENANDIGPPWRRFLNLDLQAYVSKLLSQCPRHRRLTRRSRHERRVHGIDRHEVLQQANGRIQALTLGTWAR